MAPTRLFPLFVLLSFVATGSGCLSPEQAIAQVDADAYEAIGLVEESQHGTRSNFRVETPADRLMATVIDPETGDVRPDSALFVRLADALSLAARNSRDFQDEKEQLFRTSLAFLRSQASFRAVPSSVFTTTGATSDGVETLGATGDVGLTQLFERGGRYALGVGLDALRVASGGGTDILSSVLNLSVSLPFLRNAGLQIVRENLNQAERDLLYALRDFERFKQTFGVRVVSDYLRLLSRRRRISNEEANLKSLRAARERNESFAREGRIARVEVDQARQQELQGENRLAVARQTYEGALDQFRELLGVPLILPVECDEGDLANLDSMVGEALPLTVERGLRLAIQARLDLRNSVDGVADAGRRIRVAENQLLPDFTLDLSARADSESLRPLRYDFSEGVYSATVRLDLPFDRQLESISLRSAVLDLQRALRAQERTAERVRLEVKDALRQLARSRETLRISKNAVALAEERVRSTSELQALGRASTRDFLESQDALVGSQNDYVDSLVEYRIAFLEVFRDTGVLVVSSEGLEHETSLDLLETP